MGFSTQECSWSQTTLKVLGAQIIGLQGWEFDKTFDKDYLYGADNDPIDIQGGNKAYPGSLDILKYELDKLNDAAFNAGYEDITEVPHEAIVMTCMFQKTPTSKLRTITVMGAAFTDLKAAMKQADKSMPVNLPFKSIKTIFR